MAEELFTLPPEIEPRWATCENPAGEKGRACRGNDGRKRAPCTVLKAGASLTLAEVSGRGGMVRRIWITIPDRTPKMLRGVRIEMYWDGAARPAVSAPLGDFFGHALGRMSTFQNALFSSPEGRSFNCCIPMPFRTGMKIVAVNESDAELPGFYYEVDYTLGDVHGSDTLYFHAYWHREAKTVMRQDFEFLPRIAGRGRYLGVNVGVIADKATYLEIWWGEGEVKVYLDGDTTHATLCGTGTEDYIGTGWGQGQYANLYQGCPLADWDRMQYGFYRLHLPDPVYFRKDIRVTIQQIGCCDGSLCAKMRDVGLQLVHGDSKVDMAKTIADKSWALFERQDDWSSCAYFYLDRAENGLPALAPVVDRIAGLWPEPSPEKK
jgi:hypothetical protein